LFVLRIQKADHIRFGSDETATIITAIYAKVKNLDVSSLPTTILASDTKYADNARKLISSYILTGEFTDLLISKKHLKMFRKAHIIGINENMICVDEYFGLALTFSFSASFSSGAIFSPMSKFKAAVLKK
jgi:hypothetical protein